MGVITAIEVQKRRGDRLSIFVDGEFVAGAHEEVVTSLNLRVGQTFDTDRLAEVVNKETLRKARESALRLLSFRDRTESEIRRRLVGNDFPEDIVDNVIDQLFKMGFLDDAKFCQDWIKSRTVSRPMGRTRLAWELKAKGVEHLKVEEALVNVDDSAEYDMALSLVRKKAERSDNSDPSFRQKTVSFLRRRGFGWDVINRALDEACPHDGD